MKIDLGWVRENSKTIEEAFTKLGVAAFPRDGGSFFTFSLYWDEKLRAGGPQEQASVDVFESKISGYGDSGLLEVANTVFKGLAATDEIERWRL